MSTEIIIYNIINNLNNIFPFSTQKKSINYMAIVPENRLVILKNGHFQTNIQQK